METDTSTPIIRITRFHRQHGTPQGEQPRGQLHRAIGTPCLGFFRGANLAIGYTVLVSTSDLRKKWAGTITECVTDNYTPSEGPAWFFVVETVQYTRDPMSDDTITVTVTVTSTGPQPVTSTPMVASPDPTTVP